MDIIFLLIIIGVILSKAQKKRRRRQSSRSRISRGQHSQSRIGSFTETEPAEAEPAKAEPASPESAENGTAHTAYASYASYAAYGGRTDEDAESEGRIAEKYASTKKPQVKPVVDTILPKEENIVNRAADHVQENETDILRMQMDAAREEDYGSGIAGIRMESPLMKEVEDLMIKGYDGEFTYVRDFVSEGIALLNSYELQETE